MEQELYELDMERQYEDSSFVLDQVNGDIQIVAQDLVEEEIDLAYDEFLAEQDYIDNSYYYSMENFD